MVHDILSALHGGVEMVAPRQPLAFTALLSSMAPGGTTHLGASTHPIIQVGVHLQSKKVALTIAGLPHLIIKE